MIESLGHAYEQAAIDLKATKRPPTCAKVQELFKKQKEALSEAPVAAAVGAEPINLKKKVQELHDGFIAKLEPEQQAAFAKVEKALAQGLQLTDAHLAAAPLIEPKYDTERERLHEIASLTHVIQNLPPSSKARLQSLLKLEFKVWKLLENQQGKALSPAEQEKTGELRRSFIQACTKEFTQEITGCDTVRKLFSVFKKATQLFERLSSNPGDKELLKTGLGTVIVAFLEKSTAIMQSGIEKAVNDAEGNREKALPLHHTLCVMRQAMPTSDLQDSVKLNTLISKLQAEHNIQTTPVLKKLKDLGPEKLPFAKTAAKTSSVARFIIPAVMIGCSAMQQYHDGVPPQEILLRTAAGIGAQILAGPVAQGVKNRIAKPYHFLVDMATPIVASAMASQVVSTVLTTFTPVPPAPPAPVFGPAPQTFPMTPLNATRPVLDLPTTPISAGPKCDIEPPAPGFTNITMLPPVPQLSPNEPAPSWWRGVADSVGEVAGSALKNPTQYAAKAFWGATALVAYYVTTRTGAK